MRFIHVSKHHWISIMFYMGRPKVPQTTSPQQSLDWWSSEKVDGPWWTSSWKSKLLFVNDFQLFVGLWLLFLKVPVDDTWSFSYWPDFRQTDRSWSRWWSMLEKGGTLWQSKGSNRTSTIKNGETLGNPLVFRRVVSWISMNFAPFIHPFEKHGAV